MSKYLLSLLFTAALIGCKEIGPDIDFKAQPEPGDTTFVSATIPAPQPKTVYLEEFTGVQCVNCSQGHTAIAALLAQYGERLVAVGVHSGDFSDPYGASSAHPSHYDFRTTEGDNINSSIYGGIFGQPSASVDRRKFATQGFRELRQQDWAGFTAYQSRQQNPCNLVLESKFDAAANKIKVRATVTYTQDVTADTKLSLMVTESGIKDTQLLPNGTVEVDYVHRHVLRGMLTAYNGLALAAITQRGRVFVRNFELTPKAEWRLDSCDIVGFVHEARDSVRVLQAAKIKLK
jgi:hypothetical protein